jgi:hypothetical protein
MPLKKFDKRAAVFVVPEDSLTGVASGGGMIRGAGVFDTEGTCD